MKEFKVIEITKIERDGDSYEYVTGIDVNDNGQIVVLTSGDVLKAMRFSNYEILSEDILKNQMLGLVRKYFQKKNHITQFRTVTVNITK